MLRRWELPEQPWVLHSTPLLGNLTDRWIDTQAGTSLHYGSRLLGMDAADGSAPKPHWFLARERFDLWLAYKARVKSAGLSSYWFVPQLRGSPPAVLHAHYGPVGTELLSLSRALRARLVTSFYGYDATKEAFTSSRKWARRYGRLFREGRAFVAEGPAMAARIAALGCDPAKIHVVRLPADAEGLAGIPTTKAEGFLAAVAGRFIPKKGFDLGIRAFARALGGKSDARLLIIGGGELEPSYRALVAELGIEHQAIWAGRLPFEAFMRELASAHVGLYPSRTAEDGDSEGGAPVTLIEAQWLGLPALVSGHDDLPFAAAPDGSTVLPDYSVDSWADALLGLYEERGRLDAMSEAARRFAREHHSPEANAAARERVYEATG